MKFRYTYTVEYDIPADAYPEGIDPLQTEEQNGFDVILMAIEQEDGEVQVEQIDGSTKE